MTTTAASRLGVELPNQPTAQQQGWLDELTEASGETYQRKFANLLRVSHGKVFSVIAQVRDTTRNSLVRQLATDSNQTVLDHITMLEATGLVDFDDIANGAASGATAVPTGPPPPAGVAPREPLPAGPEGDVSTTSRPSPGPPGSIDTGRPEPQM
ncbi:hypothetical protein SALBM135S_01652 [Streptomyces alboniger]